MRLLFRQAIALLLLAIAATAVAAGRPPAPAASAQKAGTLISVDPIGAVDRAGLQQVAAELPGGIAVRHGARLLRIVYWTTLKGRPLRASGLLAAPVMTAPAKGLVLFLHGTNATRALAPSQPGRVDGNEEAAVFAGNGFVVALPDYIGLGVSPVPHPYLIARPEVIDTIDLLRAARAAFARLNVRASPDLFMMGFSQGGQVVAAVHRELDRRPLAGYRLKGSVGIAGPYDLRRTSMPKAIETNCRQCVGYLGWAVYAYAAYYGHPLGEALRPVYVDVVPRLFDGTRMAMEVGGALPDDPADLFQPGFLAVMRGGGDNWFTRALAENETFAWVPVAPLRLYHGDRDLDVPSSASRAFLDYAKPRGGNVSLHALAGADHQASCAMTYAPALAWFEEMAARR